ncbi:hypothetical protein SCA6_004710 [Theobroma cacao]
MVSNVKRTFFVFVGISRRERSAGREERGDSSKPILTYRIKFTLQNFQLFHPKELHTKMFCMQSNEIRKEDIKKRVS